MKKTCMLFLYGAFLALCWGNEISIAVPVFQEIGQAPKGSGVEIALFVAGSLSSERFQVKERVHLKQWAQEQMISDPKQLDDIQQLKAQRVLLGSVSKTGKNYSVSYYLIDSSGNVLSAKDQVTARDWDTLKNRLYLSLAKHHLAPPIQRHRSKTLMITIIVGLISVLFLLFFGKFLRYRSRDIYLQVIKNLQICQQTLRGNKNTKLQHCAADLDTLLAQLKGLSRKRSENGKKAWLQMLALVCTLHRSICESPSASDIFGKIQKLQLVFQKDSGEF